MSQLAERMVNQIVADVPFVAGEEVAVMINGLGATPLQELYLFNNAVSSFIEAKGLKIYRTFVGNFMTAIDMAGASISILRLDAETKALLDAVGARSYAAARIAESRAEIDPETAQARLKVRNDSGPAFYLGELEVEGIEHLPADLVQRYSQLKPGAPYDREELLAFQTDLQNTPHFGSVIVDIERDPALAAAVPVRVQAWGAVRWLLARRRRQQAGRSGQWVGGADIDSWQVLLLEGHGHSLICLAAVSRRSQGSLHFSMACYALPWRLCRHSSALTMHCPFCAANDTKVIDSRLVAEGDQVRRRRECVACGERFTTFETAELVMPRLIKQDGSRQPFDEEKLRAGMQRALEKRPVSVERLEEAIARIKQQLRATGEREVKSLVVGELVMSELHQLDEIAYIRFASVYRRFQDLNEFREEIERLSREPGRA